MGPVVPRRNLSCFDSDPLGRTSRFALLVWLFISSVAAASGIGADVSSLAPLGTETLTLRRAAEAFTKSLQERQQGQGAVRLEDVRWDTVKVLQGRQQRMEIEVDGEPRQFLVADEPQWRSVSDLLPESQDGSPLEQPHGKAQGVLAALASGAELAPFTLAGPLEIVLTEPQTVDLQLPHSADAGVVQRILLDEGAAVQIHGARAVRLRRALDLPELPTAFLANVFGTPLHGGKVPSVGPLSGVLHFASGVWQRAREWRLTKRPTAVAELLSLQLEMVRPGGGRLVAAPPVPEEAAPRLKIRRTGELTLQLLVRDMQVSGALAKGAVGTSWAWPLPALPLTDLQRYEELLRETLASQPQSLKASPSKGVSLRLLESTTDAVTLINMEVELRHDWGNLPEVRWQGFEVGRPNYQVWRALVMLRGGETSLQYIPLHGDLVDAAHTSITFSPLAELMARGNLTIPNNLEFVYPTFGW